MIHTVTIIHATIQGETSLAIDVNTDTRNKIDQYHTITQETISTRLFQREHILLLIHGMGLSQNRISIITK